MKDDVSIYEGKSPHCDRFLYRVNHIKSWFKIKPAFSLLLIIVHIVWRKVSIPLQMKIQLQPHRHTGNHRRLMYT